jgi:DHA1 family bicyclomycin/chloramphenicol resistance-like MFS transporter
LEDCNLRPKGINFLAGAIVFFSAFSLFIFIILGGKSLGALLFFVFLALFGIGIIFPATQAGVTIPFKKDLGLISGVFYSTEMFFGAICGYVISCMDVINWYGSSLVMLSCVRPAFCFFWCLISLCRKHFKTRFLKRFNLLVVY